ncbi:hypothetical protein BDZ89DRAFT_1099326 [Hymenopellis radicata]|nr:hypothetical protein BDZ89DRAFT_1099326 [Hymenopellis radicata]
MFAPRYIRVSQTALRICIRNAHSGAKLLPIPPELEILATPLNNTEARSWIASFRHKTIPKVLVDMSFSRSSGPGGQNVNKVNTKATLRCELDADWIPLWAKPTLKKSSFYVSSSKSLMITSTVYRSQSQNVDDCLQKLHNLVLTAASDSVRNETSEETKRRVVAHEKAAKERRMKEKMYRSATKQSRSGKTPKYDG